MSFFTPTFGSVGDILQVAGYVYKVVTTYAHIVRHDSPEGFMELLQDLDKLAKLVERAEYVAKEQGEMEHPDLLPEHFKKLQEHLQDIRNSAHDMEEHLQRLLERFKTPSLGLNSNGKWGLRAYQVGYAFIGCDKVAQWKKEVDQHYADLNAVLDILNRAIQQRKDREEEERTRLARVTAGYVLFENHKGTVKLPLDWRLFNNQEKRHGFLEVMFKRSPRYRRKVLRREFKFVAHDNTCPDMDSDNDEVKIEVGAHVKLVWLPRRVSKPFYTAWLNRSDPASEVDDQEPPDSDLASEDEPEPEPVAPPPRPARVISISDLMSWYKNPQTPPARPAIMDIPSSGGEEPSDIGGSPSRGTCQSTESLPSLDCDQSSDSEQSMDSEQATCHEASATQESSSKHYTTESLHDPRSQERGEGPSAASVEFQKDMTIGVEEGVGEEPLGYSVHEQVFVASATD
ncbi:hypothetical protein OE88DRAFT_1734203 [Heliocybe sulcata]|uniref:Fungal N-terminal domain-containing protein n=1 Tax=Heliocybe sulcata TaxID=5364 RepID=A0A5C3N342_9AGAM|nr:hypothetical protein OE88DRAFT_1734203 [Heliocybe sulcata]